MTDVTFTRDSLIDSLEEHLDPDFVAKVRAVKAKREHAAHDAEEPPTVIKPDAKSF